MSANALLCAILQAFEQYLASLRLLLKSLVHLGFVHTRLRRVSCPLETAVSCAEDETAVSMGWVSLGRCFLAPNQLGLCRWYQPAIE